MSCFTEMRVLATGAPDPTKHVNFVRGMVLGEDEFKQEFAWLSGRDQWLARDLIGYGTVRGLKVQIDRDADKGPRIYVHPGVALTPAGQLVCVPTAQCAHLNEWLGRHANEVQAVVGSPPPNPLRLYLLLCYRDCPTDNVPIPGEPCRSEDQLVQPSRLRDDFILELRVERPEQREERALRAFCALLRRVDMSDSDIESVPLDRFLKELRQATAAWFSAPGSPPLEDLPVGSPPAWMQVNPKDAAQYLRAAFHLWTTELRPKWFARWYGCAPSEKLPAPLEECVLLAEVQVGLVFDSAGGAYQAVEGTLPVVMDEDRPYLLHLRMLQEWLLGGASGLPGGGALPTGPATTVTGETTFGLRPNVGTSSDYARADHTHGTPALPSVPTPGDKVVAETKFGLVPKPGASTEYSRADHTHGTPTLPPLGGDASGSIPNATVNRIRGIDVITTGSADGNVLTFLSATNNWQPRPSPTTTLNGEVIGAATNNRVARILAAPIAPLAAPLQNQQFLAFRDGTWVPAGYITVAAGQVTFELHPVQNNQPKVNGQVTMAAAFGGLTVLPYEDRWGFLFKFPGYQLGGKYIIKLTPWAPKGYGIQDPYAVYFNEFRDGGFYVNVWARPDPGFTSGNFMIEVNQVL